MKIKTKFNIGENVWSISQQEVYTKSENSDKATMVAWVAIKFKIRSVSITCGKEKPYITYILKNKSFALLSEEFEMFTAKEDAQKECDKRNR